MFLNLRVGNLIEPLTDRRWELPQIIQQLGLRIAYYQSYGMGVGDRVFIHYGNRIEFFVDILAIWSLGGCVIPIDTRLTPFEVETLAQAAMPRFSLWQEPPDSTIAGRLTALGLQVLDTTESQSHRAMDAAISPVRHLLHLDSDALILFTSGTTGQPKGVVHTHRSLRARWISLQQSLGLEVYRRTLCLLPTHFGHGLICNCLFPWLSGQDLYIVPPFKTDLILQLGALLDQHQITFMSSVPSVWRLALKLAKPPQAKTLERVFCGSAPLSAYFWQEIQEWTGTQAVWNSYGITETGSWVAGTNLPDFTPEDGLIGRPWGAIVKILKLASTDIPPYLQDECAPGEAGYIWLNTPALMKGYFNRDDLTQQVVSQGWFMTGDIGLVDEQDRLYLRGREREEINKGGMKVYPGDVDAVVEQVEGVMDVCCFGYADDPLYGQNVGIAVVLQETTPEALRHLYDWSKQRLAKHQLPVRWYLLKSIPRTSRGKVNRVNVAEVCAGLAPVDWRNLS
jgi:acyl-CoA synthetase (AMP-forming)/AMP-acid ligase II